MLVASKRDRRPTAKPSCREVYTGYETWTRLTSVLDAAKLDQLRRAVEADDWIAAADICLAIDLGARDPLDRSRADTLANAVLLRQADHIADIIDGLGYPAP
jgi:hypothetical protein